MNGNSFLTMFVVVYAVMWAINLPSTYDYENSLNLSEHGPPKSKVRIHAYAIIVAGFWWVSMILSAAVWVWEKVDQYNRRPRLGPSRRQRLIVRRLAD